MKKLIVMLIACGLLAGVSLTATVGCGDGKDAKKTEAKKTEPAKDTGKGGDPKVDPKEEPKKDPKEEPKKDPKEEPKKE